MDPFEKSKALFERARKTIPWSVPGHQNPELQVPGQCPTYSKGSQGCRFWDVDGNEYIDYMCAYGPMILGYNHPKIEAAVQEHTDTGGIVTLPNAIMVDLAEKIVDLIPAADWVLFAKNGTDVVEQAVRIARAHTNKAKIMMADGAYHGISGWCTPIPFGILDSDRDQVVTFPYNDVPALKAVFEKNRADVACIIVSPFRHDMGYDLELPTTEFVNCLNDITSVNGPLLIMDDVRAGFRLDIGGSAEYFGYKPHLSVFGKAIANGYPLSICVGIQSLMDTAHIVFFAGSFFLSAREMAAAMVTLDELKGGAIDRIFAVGEKLKSGILDQAAALGIKIHYTGPVTMPLISFEDDTKDPETDPLKDHLFFDLLGGLKMRTFCARCFLEGVWMHPTHNAFLSAAHTDQDIAATLSATQKAFEEVKERF